MNTVHGVGECDCAERVYEGATIPGSVTPVCDDFASLDVRSQAAVDSPEHYNWISGIECIDVVRHFNFCLGAALKYIWRSGRKTKDPREDLRKAIKFLNLELTRLDEAQDD